jgi:hypothetical protein
MVIAQKCTQTLAAASGGAGTRGSDAFDEFVAESLMVAFAVVQVDNPTPILLSGEKSVIRGIHGSVVLSPSTKYSSNVVSRCVGAVSRRSGIVEP